MKPPRSHLVLAILASASLYFAWQLSSPRPGGSSGPPRGPIDWVVVGLLGLAVAWNLLQLGRRLYHQGGGQAVWHLLRTLLFWVIGLMNTAWIHPRDIGTWRNWIGAVLLVVAAIDTMALHRKEVSGAEGVVPESEPGARL